MKVTFETIMSLRHFCKHRSVCISYQLMTRHSFDTRRRFRTDSMSNKLNAKNLIKIPKRFLSLEELNQIKRSKNVYRNYPPTHEFKKLVFTDNENQMAFKTIESNLCQQKYDISEENLNFDQKSKEYLNEFLMIDPDHFEDQPLVVSNLVNVLKTLSLKQLSDVLQSMIDWPVINSPFSRLFYRTWSTVDTELESRLNKLNFTDNSQVLPLLFVGNIFFRLKTANISKFNYLLVKKLSSPDFEVNTTSLVHLMFYVNLHRRIDPKTVPTLMKRCETLVKDMTLDEMGVICMTLFKTETKMSEELAKLVIFKTLTDISNETNNIMRTAIIKCLRRSANNTIRPQIKLFLNELKQLTNNSDQTLTHLLNLKTSAQVYDPQLMSYVFEKLWSEPTAFRIKDIERIFLCFSYFGVDLDKQKLKSICDELDAKSELFFIYHYPICLLNILHYLSILGHFPKPLIEHCFEQNFLSKILKYSRLDFQRHLLVTNTAVSVENYEKFKEVLVPPEKVYRYYRWILTAEKSGHQITKRSALINSVYLSLQTDLKRRVQLCHIFPFRSYPLIVIFDNQNQSFSLTPKTEFKPNMFNNCIALFILDLSDFAIVDTMIKGSALLEIRLLEKMGFKVVTIPWHQLTCFTTSRARKNKVIKEISKIDPNFHI